jgi:hypothetical protein
MKIKEGRTELTVEHEGKDLTFVHPANKGTYASVQGQIQEAGLEAPTMAQTASLVQDAFNSEDKYSQGIKKIMKDNWLWGFTGNLYVPNKGVYVQDNPEVRNGMPFMDESELVEKLEAEDPSVRFVPFGYKTENMSALDLAKNEYIIALAGEEGADKLAQVADKHKRQPYLWSFKSVSEPTTRVSRLYSGWGFVDRLVVVGVDRGDCRVSFAFGVSASDKVA